MSSTATEARSWWTLVAGVAVVSSAVTTLSILGIQSVNRKSRRHDLELEIRRATKARAGQDERKSGEEEKPLPTERSKTGIDGDGEAHGDPSRGDTQVPKYLAALAASQLDKPGSRPASPRLAPRSRTNTSNSHPELKRQPSLHMKPSLSATTSIRKGLSPVTPTYDESLIREQLSRNYSFLGEEAMERVRDAFVIVVGAGGVGSWCALMLLRSGISNIRIIDFDQVSLSSLNRHACANLADVGRPKVVVCKEHFGEIAPWVNIDARVEIFRDSEAHRLLGPMTIDDEDVHPTYVVDAIDNLDTKIDLLAYCYKHRIKCFSSMGAGAKADPGQIQVADLNMTAEDPLARKVRRGLRAKGIWSAGAMLSKNAGKKPRTRETTVKASDQVSTNKSTRSKAEEEKRAADYKSTLEKLEAKGGASSSLSNGKKLASSGRGAEERSGDEKRNSSAKPMRPSSNNGEGGYSRYSNSRRTSSASSMGSAQFFSPLITPEEERGSFTLDGTLTEGNNEVEPFQLPESAQAEESNTTTTALASPSENGTETTPQRPPLSTLTGVDTRSSSTSSTGGPSRRTSSLKELMAEDMRSSQSGKPATRSLSGLLPSMFEEEAVEHEKDKFEQPFKIMCVYSNEKSDTRLLPLDEEEYQKGNVEELAALEDFRVRILPVLGPIPAMFGLAAATYVLCDIAGKELETVPWKNRKKTYERIWTDLEKLERHYPVSGSGHDSKDMALGPRRIPWSIEDVGYVYEEVYRGRSVVPPYETLSMGSLLRWDSTLPLSYSNVALFTRAQGKKHQEEVLKHGRSPVEVWGDEAYHMFKRRMAEERRMNFLR